MKTIVTLLVGFWLGRQFYMSHCDCKKKRKSENKSLDSKIHEQHQSK